MEPARSVVQARGSFAPMDLPTSERRSLTGLYLCGAGARAAGGYRIRSSVASVVTWRVLAGRSPRTIDSAGCGARGCYDHLVGTVASSVVTLPKPDGRVDPSGRTFAALIHSAGPGLSRLTQLPHTGG